jgi:hypothetical protein
MPVPTDQLSTLKALAQAVSHESKMLLSESFPELENALT